MYLVYVSMQMNYRDQRLLFVPLPYSEKVVLDRHLGCAMLPQQWSYENMGLLVSLQLSSISQQPTALL